MKTKQKIEVVIQRTDGTKQGLITASKERALKFEMEAVFHKDAKVIKEVPRKNEEL